MDPPLHLVISFAAARLLPRKTFTDRAEGDPAHRAHVSKVEEFVARGIEAYREETPLPAGYSDASP
jgi:hypothetical protein